MPVSTRCKIIKNARYRSICPVAKAAYPILSHTMVVLIRSVRRLHAKVTPSNKNPIKSNSRSSHNVNHSTNKTTSSSKISRCDCGIKRISLLSTLTVNPDPAEKRRVAVL